MEVQVQPYAGYTMFSEFEFTVANHVLKSSEYLRVRALQTTGSNLQLVSKLKSLTCKLTVPRQTQTVYIDLISGKNSNGSDYTIQTLKVTNIQLIQIPAFSLKNFNSMVPPLIKRTVTIDYTQIGEVEQQLEVYYDMGNAINGLSTADPTSYATLLFTQVQLFYEQLLLNKSSYTKNEWNKIQSRVFIISYFMYKSFKYSTEYQGLIIQYILTTLITDGVVE